MQFILQNSSLSVESSGPRMSMKKARELGLQPPSKSRCGSLPGLLLSFLSAVDKRDFGHLFADLSVGLLLCLQFASCISAIKAFSNGFPFHSEGVQGMKTTLRSPPMSRQGSRASPQGSKSLWKSNPTMVISPQGRRMPLEEAINLVSYLSAPEKGQSIPDVSL